MGFSDKEADAFPLVNDEGGNVSWRNLDYQKILFLRKKAGLVAWYYSCWQRRVR
jgi:hypothetical protein